MSARVLYLSRDSRGTRLRRVRLVGERTDLRYPEIGAVEGVPEDFPKIAAWVRANLERARTPAGIAQVVVDVDGGVCAWLSPPSAEPAVVLATARLGASDGSPAAGGALDYFAPDDSGATIQGLGQRGGEGATRLAVLGVGDVPARLLIDALDAVQVPVESVSTLWHAAARAWDPGAPRADAGILPDAGLVPDAGPVSGVLLAEPEGRLVWCWSQGGRVLCAGSVRVRTIGEGVALGEDEAARLAAEWLSWSVQLGRSPRRLVGVLPEACDGAERFGAALTKAWAGATLDVVRVTDPVGETLARLARALEDTPRTQTLTGDTSTGIPTLARRPGRTHRRMHLARAGALLAAAGCVGIGAWHLSAAATRAKAAAGEWEQRWRATVAEVSPEAARPTPGVTPLSVLEGEVRRLERSMAPVPRTDQTQPVLEELETISLVLASAGCELQQVVLDSGTRPRLVAIVRSAQQAEAILEGLRRVGGSHVTGWTLAVLDQTRGADVRIQATYTGEWVRDEPRPAGGGR